MKTYLVGGPLNGALVQIPDFMDNAKRIGIIYRKDEKEWNPSQAAVYELGAAGANGFRYWTDEAQRQPNEPAITTTLTPRPAPRLPAEAWGAPQNPPVASVNHGPEHLHRPPDARPWIEATKPAIVVPTSKPWGRPAN